MGWFITVPMSEPLISSPVVAERLNVSVDDLYHLVRSHGLPAIRIGKRRLRFRWSEVEAWLAGNRVGVAP